MPTIESIVTVLSSLALRAGAYVFLRWIPGHHFPPIIFSLAIVYCIGFASKLLSTSQYDVVADEIDIIARPVGRREAEAYGVPDATEELDVQETIVLEKKSPQLLTTLLTGLPSPSSFIWSAVTFLINMALVAMVADLTYRSALFYPAHDLSFARLGYVSDTGARILVREPDIGKLPIYLSYRQADIKMVRDGGNRRPFDGAWKHVQTVDWLSEETDFTAPLSIEGLRPDTRYQYALSNNQSGHFVTAPPVGMVSARRDAGGKFTFLHTSCIKPHFPYNPLDHPLSVKGFEHLSGWLATLRPAFMLFLGDFIYIDVPRRHGSDLSTYRREYRQVYASPDYPSVSSTKFSDTSADLSYDIPWLHTYDDHEIANDWSSNTTGHYPAAFDPYTHYHLAVNPPLFLSTSVTPSDLVHDKTLPTWSTFTQGPASFFILDTRRYRVPSDPSDPTASMLGTLQLASLLYWLATPPPRGVHWKFVVSSVPFTKNWRGPSTHDTWAGYLPERARILDAMWSAAASQSIGVLVLSGDRHEFAATAFPPHEDSGYPAAATVHEFSVSPLSMFYLPVRTYVQDDLEDVCVKYLPDGNSKFGAVEIGRETGSGQSVLTYRLFVDGVERWSHVLTAGGRIDGVARAGTRRGVERVGGGEGGQGLLAGEEEHGAGAGPGERGHGVTGDESHEATKTVKDQALHGLENWLSKPKWAKAWGFEGEKETVLGGLEDWLSKPKWRQGWGSEEKEKAENYEERHIEERWISKPRWKKGWGMQ